MPIIRRNIPKSGIEVVFEDGYIIPAQIKQDLVKHRFKWSRFNGLYYKKYTPEGWTAIHEYFNLPTITPVAIESVKTDQQSDNPTSMKASTKKDILFLIGLQRAKQNKERTQWDINLFKSSFLNRVKRMGQSEADEALEYLLTTSDKMGVERVFTKKHKIWDFHSQGKDIFDKINTDNSSNVSDFEAEKPAEYVIMSAGGDVMGREIRDPELVRLKEKYLSTTDSFDKNRLLDNFVYSYAGPKYASSRQIFFEKLTGNKPPKAQAGINALKAEILKWLKSFPDKSDDIDKKQLELGIAIEMEHTNDKAEAEKIAMDHLKENPNYYTDPKPKNWAEKELKEEKPAKEVWEMTRDKLISSIKVGEYKEDGVPYKLYSLSINESVITKGLNVTQKNALLNPEIEKHAREKGNQGIGNMDNTFKQGVISLLPDVFPVHKLHKASIQKAISEGKPVPEKVLKDYPELKPISPEAQAIIKPEWDKMQEFIKEPTGTPETSLKFNLSTDEAAEMFKYRGLNEKQSILIYELGQHSKEYAIGGLPKEFADPLIELGYIHKDTYKFTGMATLTTLGWQLYNEGAGKYQREFLEKQKSPIVIETQKPEVIQQPVETKDNLIKWSDIPEWVKYSTPVKPISFKREVGDKGLLRIVSDFAGKDQIRPSMLGVNFENGHIVASDANKLIHLTTDSKETGNFCITKECLKLTDNKYGDRITDKFPAWDMVIPYDNSIKHEIDVLKVKTYCEILLRSNLVWAEAFAVFDYGLKAGFNTQFLIDVCEAFLLMGHERVVGYFNKDIAEKGIVLAPIGVKNNKESLLKSDFILLMPLDISRSEIYPSALFKFDFSNHTVVDPSGVVNNVKIEDKESKLRLSPIPTALARVMEKNIYKALPILDRIFLVQNRTLLWTNLETSIRLENINLPEGFYQIIKGIVLPYKVALYVIEIEYPSEIPSYDEYPLLHNKEAVFKKILTFENDFIKTIDFASQFLGQDELRPAMRSFYFIKELNNLHFVCSDSYAMFIVNTYPKFQEFKDDETIYGISENSKLANEILKALDNSHDYLEFYRHESADRFKYSKIRIGNCEIVSRHPEYNPPSFISIIPTELKYKLSFERRQFAKMFDENKTGSGKYKYTKYDLTDSMDAFRFETDSGFKELKANESSPELRDMSYLQGVYCMPNYALHNIVKDDIITLYANGPGKIMYLQTEYMLTEGDLVKLDDKPAELPGMFDDQDKKLIESSDVVIKDEVKPKVSIVSEEITTPTQTDEELQDIDPNYDHEKGMRYLKVWKEQPGMVMSGFLDKLMINQGDGSDSMKLFAYNNLGLPVGEIWLAYNMEINNHRGQDWKDLLEKVAGRIIMLANNPNVQIVGMPKAEVKITKPEDVKSHEKLMIFLKSQGINILLTQSDEIAKIVDENYSRNQLPPASMAFPSGKKECIEKLVQMSVKMDAKKHEPWEMILEAFATREFLTEAAAEAYMLTNALYIPEKDYKAKHKKAIELALSEGKPVPQEVLKEYPEIGGDNIKPAPMKSDIIDDFLPKIKIIKPFISQMQLDSLVNLYRSEEKQAAIDIATQLAETISTMPKSYETEGTETDDKIIHLHYFRGKSDWYIIEKDKGQSAKAEKEAELTPGLQYQAYGYAILGGDHVNAEWGYISIEDLRQNNVELDFYWRKKTFGELKKKWMPEVKLKNYNKSQLRTQDGFHILLVDGEAVRKDYIKFTMGGNGYAYDWIPKDEIWIDENLFDKPADMEATIKHEIFEAVKMRDEGLSYEEAHELANEMERKERREMYVIFYTNAPESYDGFGTKTIELTEYVDHKNQNKPVRKIEVADKNIQWQKQRNMSGNYTILDEQEWEKWKDTMFKKVGTDKKYMIHTNKGYYSRQGDTGNINFMDSMSLGYIYTLDEAEKMAEFISKDRPDLEFINIVVYDKDWYLNESFTPVVEKVIKEKPGKPKLNPYITMYKGKKHELYAENSAQAQVLAGAFFKVRPTNSHWIHVHLAEEEEGDVAPEPITQPEPKFKVGDTVLWKDQLWKENEEDRPEYYKVKIISLEGTSTEGETRYRIEFPSGKTDRVWESQLHEITESIEPEPAPEPITPKNIKHKAFLINKQVEASLDKKWNDAPDSYTSDELELLKQYSGAGGLDEYYLDAEGKLRLGSLYEFYTPDLIIQKMWGLAYKYGYDNGPVLEPAIGIGRFFSRKFVKDYIVKVGYEPNKYSAKICQILYPEIQMNNGKESMLFEQVFIGNNNWTVKSKVTPKYRLVIGNPPYGEAMGSQMVGMGEKSYTHARNFIDYFIFRGLDLLEPGGLLIYIIGAEVGAGGVPWLDQQNSKCKEAIAQKANLIDAYRLPEKVFDRTEVVSDIVVFRKKV